jgi:hypothetical protein
MNGQGHDDFGQVTCGQVACGQVTCSSDLVD